MTGKTHAAIGICGAAFLLVPKVNIGTAAIGLAFTVIGSYATDADLKMSKAGHIVNDIIHMTALLAGLFFAATFLLHYNVLNLIGKNMPDSMKIIGALIIAVSITLGRVTGHRKYMHSLIGFATMNIGVWLIAGEFATWFALGYALHMLVDLLNEKPEALLFPLPVGKVCFSIVPSRGMINTILTWIGYAGFLFKIITFYGVAYLQKLF